MKFRRTLLSLLIPMAGVSTAASSELPPMGPVAKQIVEDHAFLKPGYLYADKAYIDAGWALSLKQNHTIELLTPRKKQKRRSPDFWRHFLYIC